MLDIVSNDRIVLVLVQEVREYLALSLCELRSLQFFELLPAETIYFFGTIGELSIWHEVAVVTFHLLSVLVQYSCQRDQFIVLEACCLSVEDVEVLFIVVPSRFSSL